MEAASASSSTLPVPLQRSISQQSAASTRSHRSSARPRKRLASQASSASSSIAPSEDKSLTSFPSFSPESPRQERSYFPATHDDATLVTSAPSSRKTSGQSLRSAEDSSQASAQQPGQEGDLQPGRLPPSSIVAHLTSTPPSPSRGALFEDEPPAVRKVPGALHLADDAHIERLIARHGAVNLVRQIAEDLANRDDQIASMRRRAEERERALRKIILECGLSSLDLETRLRALEQEARSQAKTRQTSEAQLSDLVTDAMSADVRHAFSSSIVEDATIRASAVPLADPAPSNKGTARGWKDYIWGTGSVKRSSQAEVRTGTGSKHATAVIKATVPERRPPLQEDLFRPPEEDSVRSLSRASSVSSMNSSTAARKTSLASMALRLVVGSAAAGREGEVRGRSSSAQNGGSVRGPSSSSVGASGSTRSVSVQGGPKSLTAMRRLTGTTRSMAATPRPQLEDWGTMAATPGSLTAMRHQSYGPVEMDTIFSPEDQPPTLTHIYNNNYAGTDYLTDRYGFIYDQRRKRRQKMAAEVARQAKKGARVELVTSSRGDLPPETFDDAASCDASLGSDNRPGTPCSSEEAREDAAKPKRWQDYLMFATHPTELLSHTPLISAQGFEVLDAADSSAPARSPSQSPSIRSEDRGFLPCATTTTAAITPGDADMQPSSVPSSEGELAPVPSAKEDNEPVRLLLENLNSLHDSIQREKEARWNDFLRKVRAERKRDGEAAAAAAAAAAEARFQKATAVMPEARIADGELIGMASMGIQGKMGRAKAIEFRSLLLGGIPVAYRHKIWSECSGANALREPGYYAQLTAGRGGNDDRQVARQIEADITRTLTDNIFFRKGPGVDRLREVLLAYARRNPDVGYCQGMNLVAANLLLVTPSAEDAFWILASIVENILPPHYFDDSLIASRADQIVMRGYVKQVLPRLSAHLESLDIHLESMTFAWFLSLFTYCLSAEALFRVWDVVLCAPHEAGTFLFQVALALLKLNEPALLGCKSAAQAYMYINHQVANHAISIDGLVQASEALRRVVRRDDVELRRKKAVEEEREERRRASEARAAAGRSKGGGSGGGGETGAEGGGNGGGETQDSASALSVGS
ncbi:hypothetical protein VTJ83DRAFT_6407 [Remersonia thermophila]|uniref:Rab-GAP TBC domain-containing protein n=1 Tax=Remersonia thermophila TaxID=72144 RepID=A0ABR4D6X1_9PEZI